PGRDGLGRLDRLSLHALLPARSRGRDRTDRCPGHVCGPEAVGEAGRQRGGVRKMPLQNRVTPFGKIVAEPWRGRLMGNRGCLHDGEGRLGVRRWRTQRWISCRLEFRDRHREPMPQGRYTALFFWDEAAALAAGHRPCAECRRADYNRFMEAWIAAGLPGGPGQGGARVADRHLHRHRVTRRRQQVRFKADPADLPDGVVVVAPEMKRLPMLLWEGRLWHLSLADRRYYAAGLPPAQVTVLTPRPTVA